MGTYSNEEIRSVQMVELNILLEIDRICKEYSIEYFLTSGSVLGAVRHGGFIPWDDDIDIGMSRKNYNRFIEIAPQALRQPYVLQTYNTDRHSPILYAKIRNTDTVFLEYADRKSKMLQGIFVDVFVYDKVPQDINVAKNRQIKIQRINRLNRMKMVTELSAPPNNSVQKVKAIIRKAISVILKLIPHRFLTNAYEKEILKENYTESRLYSCWLGPKLYVFEENILFPPTFMEFEGYMFPVPAKADEYLRQAYGDYMKLPPIEERCGHKPYKIEF